MRFCTGSPEKISHVYPRAKLRCSDNQTKLQGLEKRKKMLTTTIGLGALTFAATVMHLRSEKENKSVAMKEMWKIRAYQEDMSRQERNSNF